MWHATASQYNDTSKINTKEKKTMTPFEKIIKEHLEKKAGSDAVFAEKFIERCKADQKAIEGCCAYITAEAKKKAQNGCAVIADDEVFGWAIHFFDENLTAPTTAPAAKVTTTADPNVMRAKVKPAPKPQPKPSKKDADEGMMSLFNFDEEDE